MNQVISLRTREPSPLYTFERQLRRCPHNISTLRGAVSVLNGTKNIFFLWESQDTINKTTENKVFQCKATFQDAENLFLAMLSLMGNTGWSCNPQNVNDFLSILNRSITNTAERQCVMLPKIPFIRK